MPTELIYDISEIDLSVTVADVEGIARVIPQRGDMLQIDRIVWHDPTFDRGVAVKEVAGDEFWVPGHIPEKPLLPGVLMIEAAAQLASWLYYKRSDRNWFAGFTRIEDTTFRGPVVPGDTLVIAAQSLKFHPKRFICRCQGFVDQQIVFDTTVTGLAMTTVPKPESHPASEYPKTRAVPHQSAVRG